MDKSMDEMIAYQSVDGEGDIWCNTAILFKNDADCLEFFSKKENVIKALKIELCEDETLEDIGYELYYANEDKEGLPIQVVLECMDGTFRLQEMARGYVYNR